MIMYRKVSLSEALFFYLSLFWRAILLYLKKYYTRKTNQANKPAKQLAAPDHLRDVVGSARAALRPKDGSVADELRR